LKLEPGLAKIKGVGISYSRTIIKVANLNPEERIGNMSEEEIKNVRDILQNPHKYNIPEWLFNRRKDLETGHNLHLIGADLTLRVKSDINFMREIRSWKGVRHSLGLKVRGQRTKTTARSGRSVGVRRKRISGR
jgi:small subunit ribosomal protein S13